MKSLATIPYNRYDLDMTNKIREFQDSFEKDLAKIADVDSNPLIAMIAFLKIWRNETFLEDIPLCNLKCFDRVSGLANTSFLSNIIW